MSGAEQPVLEGRTALVTGASRGIGRALSIGLSQAGCRVILAGRDKPALAETQAALRVPPDGRVSEIDIQDETAIVSLARDLGEEGWTPDILVNNAGVIDRASLVETTTEGFERVVRTNLSSAYILCREFAKPMIASGFGRIINISSILGIQGKANVCSYTASKHGIIGLTRSLAAELGKDGITVNAVCPGYIRTEINTVLQNDPEYDRKIRAQTPVGRWGVPEDLVGPAVFLASAHSSYVSGHVLVVDGGMTATH